MAENKFDQTLKLIAKGDSLYKIPTSELDDEVLEKLMQDGLIKRNHEGGFSLTGYGEIIEVMGYKAHQKKKKRSNSSGKQMYKNWILIVMIVLVVITGGVIMLI